MKRLINFRWVIAAIIIFIFVVGLLFSYSRIKTDEKEPQKNEEQKRKDTNHNNGETGHHEGHQH